ncbi:HNH endonuclease [Mycobacterium paragordonae]|uniref:HNH endonuclease n=1 Tax=Mycobacterium paragordonae TaxID=1389713 RepID=UPI002413401A|nr:HNH endonuclease [Mycobacterium paragordonae]
MQRPCLGCGCLIASGSRCAGCQPSPKRTAHQRGYTSRWRRLSEKQRKASPFCERCGSLERLECDHIIPINEAPALALEPLNTRVLCRRCNRARGGKATQQERTQVLAALEQERARRRH